MSKIKLERDLSKVREQIASLKKKEASLEQELKQAEAMEKQSILDKHHISAEDLIEMIKAKHEEEKRLLSLQTNEGGNKPNV